jgi:hypothetical protein
MANSAALDFPSSDMAQLIPIIVLNVSTIVGNLFSIWKVWKCFKKGSILSITLLGALFFMLITQVMLISFYLPISWNIKTQLWHYRLLFGFLSSFFSCASVLHRFYSLISIMTQYCCIKNEISYKIFTLLITGLLLALWVTTFYLTAAQDTSLRLSLGVFYWTISIMLELIIGTILLYLILKSKRPTMMHLTLGAYLVKNYRPIVGQLLCYATAALTGVITSLLDFSLGLESFSFLRLLSAISEGWYYICQVWFLVLIRDTTENMDYASKISQISGHKLNSNPVSKKTVK